MIVADGARVALYYAPEPGDRLWKAGCGWLGRDAASGKACEQPEVCGLVAITHDARRYGFHATLKAPFRLRSGAGWPELLQMAAEIAQRCEPFALPPLRVDLLDGFLALLADAACPGLQELADAMVAGLDGLRAPLTEAERQRRAPARLSPAQRAMLAAWGYPDVFGQWRFHMTLSRRLSVAEAGYYRPAADRHFAAALAPARPRIVRQACLFVQPAPGAAFALAARLPLGGRG